VLEQRVNETPLPESEVPVDSASREPMESPHWLLSEYFLQFVSCHLLFRQA
jgi:hypothetical protein